MWKSNQKCQKPQFCGLIQTKNHGETIVDFPYDILEHMPIPNYEEFW